MIESTVIVRRPQVGPMGRIIRIAISTVTVAMVLASGVNAVLGHRDIAILFALGAPLGVSAWGFARVGHHEAAVVLLSLVLTTVTTMTLYLSTMGVHDHAVIAYSGVLLFNALLLSRPKFIAMAAVVLGCGGLVFVLQAMGLTQSRVTVSSGWLALFDFLLITGVIGGLARVVAEILYGSLGDAQQVAIKDPVTGVSNRARFLTQAAARLRSAESDEFGVLAIADIANFRRVNHVVGHAAADRILVEVAKRVQGVEPGALVGRVGDDEFALLVLGLNTAGEVDEVLQKLREKMRFEHFGVSVRAAVGEARVPGVAKTIDALLMAADASLSEAKRDAPSRPSGVTAAR